MDYVCVHCGSPAKQLYSLHPSSGALCLDRCGKCGEVVDKYVEFDPVLVLLDALLYRMEVYRHVFINTTNKGMARWAVIIVVIDLIYKWLTLSLGSNIHHTNHNQLLFISLVKLTGLLVHVSVITMLFCCYHKCGLLRGEVRPLPLFIHLLVSCYSKLLYLLLILWGLHGSYLLDLFLLILLLLSNVQALRAICNASVLLSVLTTGLGLACLYVWCYLQVVHLTVPVCLSGHRYHCCI